MEEEAAGRPRPWAGESTAGQQADLLLSIASPALRAAALSVAQRCRADTTLGETEADVRARVLNVAAAVASDSGETASLPGDPRISLGILDMLRVELLREWERASSPPTPDEMIARMRALETVSEALRGKASDGFDLTGFPSGVEFVTGVAHDLRSPLTSILFLAETLHSEQSGEINDVQRRQLGIIYSAALGLVSVASDIIELVRGGEGLSERKPTLFSVTEIMESVRDIVRPMAEEKGLRVQLFPPATDQRMGYPLALSRVLLNLTTNGLKFTDSGFVELSVRSVGRSRVEFSVRDTGKGYATEAMTNLYQPFRRSRDGKKYGFSGTGLGLAISRKLVVAMGSQLQVETRPTWGTRFYFELDLPPGPTT